MTLPTTGHAAGSEGTAPRARAPFLVRHRTKVALALFLLLLPSLVFVHHSWPESTYADFVLDSTGYALLMAGVLGRLWCTLYIGGRKNAAVVCTGPYSMVRHPLYLSNLLLALGLSSLSENPVVLLIVVIHFIFQYRVTIAYEETSLAAAFGEQYRQYARMVPRFIPRPRLLNPAPPEAVDVRALGTEALTCLLYLLAVPLLEFIGLLHELGVLPFVRFP